MSNTVESMSDIKVKKTPDALRQDLERKRNRVIKKCYVKLFMFMRDHEHKIGSDFINEFIESHTEFEKETITFVMRRYAK